MADWRPQHYRKNGLELGVDPTTLENSISAAEVITSVDPRLPPVLTLKHLAHLTDADYGLLRAIVSRQDEDPYRVFRIRKRPSENGEKRFRTICVPDPSLLRVQRWIAQEVVALGRPHSASTAYSKGSRIIEAAKPHCGCRWLIKLDVRNFFESITEISAFRAFRRFGYQPLVAFEMTRLCTRLGGRTLLRRRKRWTDSGREKNYPIRIYRRHRMGHLPQGAPTSPMLANLAMVDFDAKVSAIALEAGLTYTRYADDLAFSTSAVRFDRLQASQLIGKIYAVMGDYGLSPNSTKTRVLGPGTRKTVLGLLVDGAQPRLSREFKANLRMHLYYLQHPAIGPTIHAARRGFTAVGGLRNHVRGLISYARQIEPAYAALRETEFYKVRWPS